MKTFALTIVGGGLAGAVAAESYRAAGGDGSVLLLSADPALPVHRPPLSKGYLRGEEKLDSVRVHTDEFYRDHEIELRLNTRVERLDPDGQRLETVDGETVGYDRLVLATGATPRALTLPGADLDGVYSLRSLGDADALRQASAHAAHAVIVGAGFIGMEVAASLAQRGINCTIVELAPRVWPRLVSAATSEFMQRYFEQRGIRFIFGREIDRFDGPERVTSVVMAGGERIEADLVLAGVGVTLNTQLAAGAGLSVDQGVVVDRYLRSSHPNVFAIGDIANFPDPIGGRLHLEHWDNALHQGRTVGKTLAGTPTAFQHTAYFFSDLFDLSVNMLGYPIGADRTLVRGTVSDGRFTNLYLRDGVLQAVLMINDDAYFAEWQQLIEARQSFDGAEARLCDTTIRPTELLATALAR